MTITMMNDDDTTHSWSSDGDDFNDDDDNNGDDYDDDVTHAGSSPQTGPEDLISGYCNHLPEKNNNVDASS